MTDKESRLDLIQAQINGLMGWAERQGSLAESLERMHEKEAKNRKPDSALKNRDVVAFEMFKRFLDRQETLDVTAAASRAFEAADAYIRHRDGGA